MRVPVVFVYVRRGPSLTLGEPCYQRRLDGGVPATGELLEGHPAPRVVEFARLPGARLIVLGSRRRLLGSSVSRRVIRWADCPVVGAGRTAAAPA